MADSQINNFFTKLETTLKVKKISAMDLAVAIDVTPQGLNYAKKNDSIRLKTIIDISDYLGVPLSYWFNDEAMVLPNDKDKQTILELEKKDTNTVPNATK